MTYYILVWRPGGCDDVMGPFGGRKVACEEMERLQDREETQTVVTLCEVVDEIKRVGDRWVGLT